MQLRGPPQCSAGEVPALLQKTTDPFGVPEPSPHAAPRLLPFVAQGLRSSAPPRIPSLVVQESLSLSERGLQRGVVAPSCPVDALSGLHHCQTSPTL